MLQCCLRVLRPLIFGKRFKKRQGVDILGNFHDIYLVIPRLVGGEEDTLAVGGYARVDVALLPFTGAIMQAEGARLGIALLRELPEAQESAAAVTVTDDERFVTREDVPHIEGECKGLVLRTVKVHSTELTRTKELLVCGANSVAICKSVVANPLSVREPIFVTNGLALLTGVELFHLTRL